MPESMNGGGWLDHQERVVFAPRRCGFASTEGRRRSHRTIAACGSAGGAGQERRHDFGGVAIVWSTASVVAHGRTGISVAGRLLDVAKSDPGVKCGGNEGMPEAVRTDPIGNPGSPGKSAYGAVGA